MIRFLVDSLLGRRAHVGAPLSLHEVDSHEDHPLQGPGSRSDAGAHRVQSASPEPIHRESFLSFVQRHHEGQAIRNHAATYAVSNWTWTSQIVHPHFHRHLEGELT